MLGGRGDAERSNRILVFALAVEGIAQPEGRRIGKSAGGIAPHECAEAAGGRSKVTPTQLGQRLFILPLFLRVSQELAPLHAHLHRLELAHAVFYTLRNIFLLALKLREFANQLLIGSAHAREFGAQLFKLRVEVQHRLAQTLNIIALLLDHTFKRRDLGPQIQHSLSGLIIREQLGLNEQRGAKRPRDQSGAKPQEEPAPHFSGPSVRRGDSWPRPIRHCR